MRDFSHKPDIPVNFQLRKNLNYKIFFSNTSCIFKNAYDMSSSTMHQPEQNTHEQRQEQTRDKPRQPFVTARNENGQFIPMGGRDYSKDYASKDYASKDYASKDYGGGSSGKDYGSSNKDYGSSNKENSAHSDMYKADEHKERSGEVINMLKHIESLEAKLASKDRILHDTQQRVDKFSARTREGMQSALDSLMKKWMDACDTKDDKCKEQFKHGMEKLVQNSAEENGVWQMMVAASALHQRQEHDLNNLRGENNTLKEKIDGHYATSDSRTGAPGKRKAEHDADEHGEHATTEDLWGSFAKDCGGF
jgi:hypothetical protein